MTAVSMCKQENSAGAMRAPAPHVAIRAAKPSDREWIRGFRRVRWTAATIVVHGEAIDAAALPALIAVTPCGLATWRQHGADAELVTLDSVPAGLGTGTALIEALVAQLRVEGCQRLWLTMTNDNISALRFYQRRGFRLVQVRPGAVDAARALKPSIPAIGAHGISMQDELDLCRVLDAGTADGVPVLPPWSRASAGGGA